MPLASFQQGRPSEAMVHAGQTPSTRSARYRSTSVVLRARARLSACDEHSALWPQCEFNAPRAADDRLMPRWFERMEAQKKGRDSSRPVGVT